jgi:hypothetical protein
MSNCLFEAALQNVELGSIQQNFISAKKIRPNIPHRILA